MRRLALGLTLFVFGTGVALAVTNTAKLVGPKYTLKEVMGKAHKEGLLKKVTAGDASAEAKSQLLDLYVAMYDHEAPKGDAGSWTEKTSAAVVGAAKVVLGQDGAEDALKKAVNCGACHKAHK